MARLNAKERNALPTSTFGMPAERKYPMPDASHAANAKARASQAANAGRISRATEKRIDAKANAVLGKGSDAMTHHPSQKEVRAIKAKQAHPVSKPLAELFRPPMPQASRPTAKPRGEGGAADKRQEAALAKRTGMSMKQVERSAADKKADAARMKRK